MEKYKIYTDGAASHNGKANAIGGWAFIIIDSSDNIVHFDSNTRKGATNQQMELEAVIEGCKYAINNLLEIEEGFLMDLAQFQVYSDSAYVINCYKDKWYENWMNNGWVNSKKQSVANSDLWIRLIPFFEDARFTFEKVKGHADDKTTHSKWNNFVDDLAVKAKI